MLAPSVVSLLFGCLEHAFEPAVTSFANRIQAGSEYGCALSGDGGLWCWGQGTSGQIGVGSRSNQVEPVHVLPNTKFLNVGIHGLGNHTCAVRTDGVGLCWGSGTLGQLGRGVFQSQLDPMPIFGSIRFNEISAGDQFSCGVATTLHGYCWGRGVFGQLGNETAVETSLPDLVAGDFLFTTIQAGSGSMACGLTTTKIVACWGMNGFQGLGSTTVSVCTNSLVSVPCAIRPTPIESNLRFKDLAVGRSFACAITLDGDIYCWGRNDVGQLGIAPTAACRLLDITLPCNPIPQRVDIDESFVNISAGGGHTCAVADRGVLYCWGLNLGGSLGLDTFADTIEPPTRIVSNFRFAEVSLGENHTCGIRIDGAIFCWGGNDFGQIGDGTQDRWAVPRRVLQF